jgi:L-alanine-DL-glutamate epimerase-like enolase superfamily enzyme
MPFKGGITGSMKTAWICEAFGVMCAVHGSPVPSLHVACAIPSCKYFESIVPPEGFFLPPGIDVASTDIDSEGCVQPWEKPGLGLEIDWDWVEAHTVRLIE